MRGDAPPKFAIAPLGVPTAVFPLGSTTVTLVVNDGYEDSDADTVDLGDVAEVKLYTCDDCRKEYRLVKGRLVPAAEAA